MDKSYRATHQYARCDATVAVCNLTLDKESLDSAGVFEVSVSNGVCYML